MTLPLQDGIVSLVALGAVTAIVVRARSLFAPKPSGTPCGSCKCGCPSTAKTTATGARLPTAGGAPAQKIIPLTVLHASGAVSGDSRRL